MSISRTARVCGVNANQLSLWIREHRQRQQRAIAAPPTQQLDDLHPAFAPVSIQTVSPTASTPTRAMTLQVCLLNGVVIDVRDCDSHQAGRLLEPLRDLRCSDLVHDYWTLNARST